MGLIPALSASTGADSTSSFEYEGQFCGDFNN
jgi:hypothetical protein